MNNKGSVSIFFIIITISTLLFAGLFIDLSRILLANIKVQNALNSAARSTLANYDKNLVSEYGLYAISKDQAKVFNKYYKANLNIAKNENFNLLNLETDDKDIFTDVSEPLKAISNESFKRQIMEYMKYKAPINITRGVINKFASAFSANRLAAKGKNEVLTFSYSNFKKTINETCKKAMNKAIDSIKDDIDDAKNKLLNEDKIDTYNNIINSLETQLGSADANLNSAKASINSFETDVNNSNATVDTIKNEENISSQENARTYNNTTLKLAKTDMDKINNEIANSKNTLSDIKSKLNNLLPSYYSLKKNISTVENRIVMTDDEMKAKSEELSNLNSQKTSLENQLQPVIDKFSNIGVSNFANVDAKGSIDAASQATKQDSSTENKMFGNITELYNKINDFCNSVKKFIDQDDISTFIVDTSTPTPTPIKDNSNAYVDSNNNDTQFEDTTDEEKLQNNSASIFNMFDKIKNIITAAEEDVYITEYIMDKCTYLTSQTERNRYFKYGEVEYIIFGNNSQMANVTAAVATIATIRMAINTVDYFIMNPDPEPISRLCYALTRGGVQTLVDMAKMIFSDTGEACTSLSPSLSKIHVTYSDHLRLALLIKLKDSGKLPNLLTTMRATMKNLHNDSDKENPNTDINDLNTQIHAKVKTKVNLVFLPMLGIEKLNLSNFESGKYCIYKEISMGY